MIEVLMMHRKFCFQELLVARHQREDATSFFGFLTTQQKKIRIYDNTQHKINISATDMDMLKDAFRNLDSLEGWTVCNPQQWQRNDGSNSGVFVCTAAEMEAKGLNMSSELLHTEQLIHLRVYHASWLVENTQTEDFTPKLTTSEAENRCLAQEIGVCVFQKTRNKTMHPDLKTLQWIQCDICNEWLHYDCAGINQATVTKDMAFSCGGDIEKSYPYEKTLSMLKQGLVVNIVDIMVNNMNTSSHQ
ncbi:uncharacterized protein LOC143745582 [Siphateles boraxobius]|uniref:uncharacterized protein LOC143745582 n=1 Tax=Siphateles boraxobius TaxID=180520 RepID=UPI00406336DD